MPLRTTAILCAALAATGLARGAAAQTTFQTGDAYVIEAVAGEARIHNVTAGGDFSGATPFATLTGTGSVFGEICFSAKLDKMFVADFGAGVVHAVTPAGSVSTFATGLTSPVAVACRSGRVYAQEFASGLDPSNGSVVDITAGGNFASAPAFVSSTTALRGMTVTAGAALLIGSWDDGRVRIGTNGGAFTSLPLLAALPGAGVVQSIDEGPNGEILVAVDDEIGEYQGGPIFDFGSGTPTEWATGLDFVNTATRVNNGQVLASAFTSDEIFDVTGGGDFALAAAFATGFAQLDTALAAVPEPSFLFEDGFESIDVCAWSDSVGDGDDCTPPAP
jgi:hypothetical protein